MRHVLTSYLQFYEKGGSARDLVKMRKQADPQVKFMVDSGAHTFITDTAKFAHWSRDDFESYVRGYCDWVRENREFIFAAVELDIDLALNRIFANGDENSQIGPTIVEEWQKKYFIPLQNEGIDIIFVWHVERKLEGWEDMCKRFAYVGLPGYMSKQDDFNKYISVARRYTTKIHGFAATKQADFRDWPWFSVDSITWKTAEMYGTLIHWDERRQKIKFETEKPNRRLYRSYFEKHGLDADGIINDTNYKEVTKYSLISIRGMEAFYENKYRDRVFYYELRMPQPEACIKKDLVPLAEILQFWKLCRPDDRFDQHADQKSPTHRRRFLAAIACVQNLKTATLESEQPYVDFLSTYFPKLFVNGKVIDENAFQRELALYLSPPNPPVQKRTDMEHYTSRNAPKSRSEVEFTLADLEHNPEDEIQFQLDELEMTCR